MHVIHIDQMSLHYPQKNNKFKFPAHRAPPFLTFQKIFDKNGIQSNNLDLIDKKTQQGTL